MGYKIRHIIIPEADIQYKIGYNNVCEIRESFKQVSNNCIKNTYVVKFKKGIRLDFAEISADAKETHQGNKHEKDYLALVEFIKVRFE